MHILEQIMKEPIQKIPDNPIYDYYEYDDDVEDNYGEYIDKAYEEWRDEQLMQQYEESLKKDK